MRTTNQNAAFSLSASCAFLLLLAVNVAPSSAQEDSPFKITVKSGQDRQISYYVGRGLQDDHLLQREIDDEVSQRALKNFLKRLDARKYYFLQSDIDQFEKFSTTIDDMLLARDVTFGTMVFHRFIERIEDRQKDITELLAGDFDFTIDEEFIINGKEETYPADAAAARDLWRKRLKHELLILEVSQKKAEEEAKKKDEAPDEANEDEANEDEANEEDADDDKPEDPKVVLAKRYENVRRRMRQTDSDEVLEYFLTAVTSSFDPHSTYFSPSSLEDFRIRMGLNYQGIGAELSDEDGEAIITRIMPNGGAEKGGELKAGDRIVSVGQEIDGEMIDVVDMKLQDIIEKIRGPEGTVVRVGVIPKGLADVEIYNITRSRIELGDSAAKSTIMDIGEGDQKKRVGIIDLPSFYLDLEAMRRNDPNARSTSNDMAKLLDEFKEEGVDAVVVDLRRNGGGSLSESVAATGLFIRFGPVVQVKDTVNGIVRHSDRDAKVAWDGPLVVLTSRFSASASEIFAGALQDYGRALVVGDSSTHGKGTVQSLQELGPLVFKIDSPLNLGALKITIQQFYRPSGISTQNRGVESDVVIPSFTEHFAEGESSLDYAIPFDEIPPTRFTKRDDISATLVTSLRELSQDRITKSDDFKELSERVIRFNKLEERMTMPLQRKKFVELQEQMNNARDEQRRLFAKPDKPDEVVNRDFYMDEVLAVAADLVTLGEKE
jgi:carboxyl-terminal processing protease